MHPEMAGLKRSEVKAAVGKKFKASEDRIAVFGLKPRFGGGRSTAFVFVYDDVDARIKYDTKVNLNRVSARGSDFFRMRELPVHSLHRAAIA